MLVEPKPLLSLLSFFNIISLDNLETRRRVHFKPERSSFNPEIETIKFQM